MAHAVVRLGYNDEEVKAGLQATSRHFKAFSAETKGAFSGIGSGLKNALSGLAAGFTIGGIKGVMDDLDRVAKLSMQLDVSGESLQRVGHIAELSGAGLEATASALNRVNRELANGEGARAFKALGINIGKYLSLDAEDQLFMLAQAFQDAEKNGKGLTEAYDLFGKKASELLPILRSNIEALREAGDVDVFSEAQLAEIEAFNDDITKLWQSIEAGAGKSTVAMKDLWGGLGRWLNNKDLTFVEAAYSEMQERQTKEYIAAEAKRKDREARAATRAKAAQDTANAAAEKAAEAARKKQEAEDAAARKTRAAQQEKLESIRAELAILRARESGNAKLADQLERELKIRAEAARIAKETGLAEGNAMQLARTKADLEDKVNGKQGRIRGYSQGQDSFSQAHQTFRNLDAMHRAQYGDFWARNQRTPGLDAFHRLQDRSQPAFSAGAKKIPTSTDRSVEQLLRKIAEGTDKLKEL